MRRILFVALVLAFTAACFAQELATPPAIGYKDSFQTNFVSYGGTPNPLINITNPGFHGGPGAGDMCVNVYTFRPDQSFVNCCSCRVTPNGLVSLNGIDLGFNNVGNRVVKLIAGQGGNAVTCDPTAAPDRNNRGGYATGMRAWGSHAQAVAPFTSDTEFLPVPLGDAELARLTSLCLNLPVVNRCLCFPVTPASASLSKPASISKGL